LWVAVAEQISAEDGDKTGKEDGVDGGGLDASGVEGEGEEADGYVEDFTGNFVFVNLWSC
jgi:hypothetical protein